MHIPDFLRRFGFTGLSAVNDAKRLLPIQQTNWLLAAALQQWASHPVLFRPTEQMSIGMSHTDVNLPPSQYRQCYDTLMIAHPDRILSIVSIITHPTMGRMLFVGHTLSIHDPLGGHYCLIIGLNDGRTLPDGRVVRTIEDVISAHMPSLPIDQNTTTPYNRVAINLALLLSSYPTHRVRTERERMLLKATKGDQRSKAVAAKQKLKLLPQVIDFVNPPKTYQESGVPTGATRPPHWRRGHFRLQAYGTRWTQHKAIFIMPMLIHRELADGTANTIEIIGRDRPQTPTHSNLEVSTTG